MDLKLKGYARVTLCFGIQSDKFTKRFSFLLEKFKVSIIVLARDTIVAFKGDTYINRPRPSLVYVIPGERGRLGEKLGQFRVLNK